MSIPFFAEIAVYRKKMPQLRVISVMHDLIGQCGKITLLRSYVKRIWNGKLLKMLDIEAYDRALARCGTAHFTSCRSRPSEAQRDSQGQMTISDSDRAATICLLGGALNNSNMGVNAITASAIECILRQQPRAEIFLLDYGEERQVHRLIVLGHEIHIPVLNLRFSKKLYLSNNIALLLALAIGLKLIPSRRVRLALIARSRCLRQIQKADIVASIGGGDSFSDIYGLERFFYISLPQILALLLGKRLILLPQTIGPFYSNLAKGTAKYILRRAERVCSRDFKGLKDSKDLLGPRHVPEKCVVCYDLAFALNPTAPSDVGVVGLPLGNKKEYPLIGLNVSGLLFGGGGYHADSLALRDSYKELVYSLIHNLITQKQASVLLVPHVIWPVKGSESDSIVCQELYEALRDRYPNRIGMAAGAYNQNEIKYVIGLCEFFIGSRMHACIAAVSQHVPAVSIAYSDKFVGVMETIGIESLVADARKLNSTEIQKVVDQAYDRRATIRRQLEQKMVEVRQALLSFFDGLSGPTWAVGVSNENTASLPREAGFRDHREENS